MSELNFHRETAIPDTQIKACKILQWQLYKRFKQ